MEELRVSFHRIMDEIDGRMVQLFALVSESLAASSDALLAGDRALARDLMARDGIIDGLYIDVEELVQNQFALQSPMARDLRYLLSVLRIVPELERSGDLAEHIALRAARGLNADLTPRMRGLLAEMAAVGGDMWRMVGDAWSERDASAAAVIDHRDDEMDDLHATFTAEVGSGEVTVPVAMELALVGRFYERLGDHAVNIAERIRYLAAGH